jgi:hypothetical protein
MCPRDWMFKVQTYPGRFAADRRGTRSSLDAVCDNRRRPKGITPIAERQRDSPHGPVARGPTLSAFCGRLWHLPAGAGTTGGKFTPVIKTSDENGERAAKQDHEARKNAGRSGRKEQRHRAGLLVALRSKSRRDKGPSCRGQKRNFLRNFGILADVVFHNRRSLKGLRFF